MLTTKPKALAAHPPAHGAHCPCCSVKPFRQRHAEALALPGRLVALGGHGRTAAPPGQNDPAGHCRHAARSCMSALVYVPGAHRVQACGSPLATRAPAVPGAHSHAPVRLGTVPSTHTRGSSVSKLASEDDALHSGAQSRAASAATSLRSTSYATLAASAPTLTLPMPRNAVVSVCIEAGRSRLTRSSSSWLTVWRSQESVAVGSTLPSSVA